VVMREQELAHWRRAWRHDEARVAAGTACRAWKKVAGRSKAAVGQGATRGVAGKQEVALDCSDGEQWRGVARVDGRAAWHGREKTAQLGEGGGAGRRRHVARPRAAQGWQGRSTWPAERQRRGAEKKHRRREGGRRKRTEKQNPKNTGTPL
jgi:hypothetical protein